MNPSHLFQIIEFLFFCVFFVPWHTSSSFLCSAVCTHLCSCLSNFLRAVDGEGLQTRPCWVLLRAFELQRCSCVAIRQQASRCIQIDHWVILFVFIFKRYTRFKRLQVGIDDELSLSEQVGSLLCHVKISGDSQSFCLSYVFFCSTLAVFFSFICFFCSTLKALAFFLFFGSFVIPRLSNLHRSVCCLSLDNNLNLFGARAFAFCSGVYPLHGSFNILIWAHPVFFFPCFALFSICAFSRSCPDCCHYSICHTLECWQLFEVVLRRDQGAVVSAFSPSSRRV